MQQRCVFCCGIGCGIEGMPHCDVAVNVGSSVAHKHWAGSRAMSSSNPSTRQ
jgi:hypothetical protein